MTHTQMLVGIFRAGRNQPAYYNVSGSIMPCLILWIFKRVRLALTFPIKKATNSCLPEV